MIHLFKWLTNIINKILNKKIKSGSMEIMFKNFIFFIGLFFSLNLFATQNTEKKSGYRYIIDNYFSKRASAGNYYDYSRGFTLSSGLSIYRANKNKTLEPFSSLNLSFTQNLKEIAFLGDLNLKVSIFSSQMATRRATLLEVAPFITIPEIKTTFPFYAGMGFGFGFYPRYLIKPLPVFSVSSQFFFGLRVFEVYHNIGFFSELNLRIHYPFSELKAYLATLAQAGLIFRF